MSKKHILVVSQYFYPEPFRINDICKEWVKRGYKVTVITGIPNYPEGKFYKGYSWSKKRKETWEGIDIIRIPLISRGKSAFRLILNYYSFVFFGFFWKMFTKIKADIVFTFEVSPMTQALLSVWYSKKRKVPHYLYVQDLWPDNIEIVAGIKNKLILKSINKMVNKIYKNSNLIFATSESFVKTIQERIFEDKDKVKFWPQYAEDFYQPVCVNEIPDELNNDSFKIIFTGNIGQAQGLDVLPKVAKILKAEQKDIKFVIVGGGREKSAFISKIKEFDVEDMFTIIERQPAQNIPKFLCSCQAAFVSFMDNPLFEKTIPAKLQSYMACGMPIIASANGETKRIIEEANCGICANIGDEKDLANKISSFIENNDIEKLGFNAKAYSDKFFNKKTLMDDMDLYIGMVNKL